MKTWQEGVITYFTLDEIDITIRTEVTRSRVQLNQKSSRLALMPKTGMRIEGEHSVLLACWQSPASPWSGNPISSHGADQEPIFFADPKSFQWGPLNVKFAEVLSQEETVAGETLRDLAGSEEQLGDGAPSAGRVQAGGPKVRARAAAVSGCLLHNLASGCSMPALQCAASAAEQMCAA